MQITSWGKYPLIDANEIAVPQIQDASSLVNHPSWIPRGMARSYGDSSLGKTMLSSLKWNRFLAFNPKTGILTCEAGITFEDILTHFVPKGWFPPVTPGTKFVSMGGAIASDVHGKNHHKEGSFSQHTLSFTLCTAKGEIITCSRAENASIFWATFGGMGLTGIVLTLTLQLKKIETAWIKMESIKTRNLAETLAVLNAYESATYTVAWTDCLMQGKNLGRSVFMKGEHASLYDIAATKHAQTPLQIPSKLQLSLPFNFPSFTVNSLTVKAFNFLYYNKQFSKETHTIANYDTFFYPLDFVHHWNRIYGKKGFTQYQFVIPKEKGYEGMKRIIQKIGEAGLGSFLVVLKTFGEQNSEYLAFPQAGYTLALDFGIEPRVFPFLEELDKIVLEYGGRVYLTKDARLSAETFRKMYPTLPQFQQVIQSLDPERKIQSLQSVRLGI